MKKWDNSTGSFVETEEIQATVDFTKAVNNHLLEEDFEPEQQELDEVDDSGFYEDSDSFEDPYSSPMEAIDPYDTSQVKQQDSSELEKLKAEMTYYKDYHDRMSKVFAKTEKQKKEAALTAAEGSEDDYGDY